MKFDSLSIETSNLIEPVLYMSKKGIVLFDYIVIRCIMQIFPSLLFVY